MYQWGMYSKRCCRPPTYRLWDTVGLVEMEKALEVHSSVLSPLPATYWPCSFGVEGNNSTSLSFGFFIIKIGIMMLLLTELLEG